MGLGRPCRVYLPHTQNGCIKPNHTNLLLNTARALAYGCDPDALLVEQHSRACIMASWVQATGCLIESAGRCTLAVPACAEQHCTTL